MALFKKKDPRDRFVAEAEKTLQRLGITGPIEFDPDLFAYRLSGDRMIMLGNLFGRWQSLSKGDAAAYLETAVAGLVAEADQPKTFDAELSDRHRIGRCERSRHRDESNRDGTRPSEPRVGTSARPP